MKLCKCNKCSGIFEDTNPQTNAKEFPEMDFPSLEQGEDKDGEGYSHHCPVCLTDNYLMDLEELPDTTDETKSYKYAIPRNEDAGIYVDDDIYFDHKPLPYRWENTDDGEQLYVLHEGAWKDTQSIDWKFTSDKELEKYNHSLTIDAILDRWPDVLPKHELTRHECFLLPKFDFPLLHRFSFLSNPSFNGSISGFTTYPVKYTTEEDTGEKTVSQCDSSEAQAWGIYANVHEKNEATGSEWIFDVENEKTAKELVSLLTLIGLHFTKQR